MSARSTRPPTANAVKEASRDSRFLGALLTRSEPYMFWRNKALCRDYDAESFFPSDSDPKREQLRLCSVCPVRAHCLATALDEPERFGIWGCTTEDERQPMLVAWRALTRKAAS